MTKVEVQFPPPHGKQFVPAQYSLDSQAFSPRPAMGWTFASSLSPGSGIKEWSASKVPEASFVSHPWEDADCIVGDPRAAVVLTEAPKASGGDNDYWVLHIRHPKRLEPYKVEAEDIIEAFNMPFAEATVFKSLWRLCQLRLGAGKPGSTETYEADKMVYYSQRTRAKIENRK